VELLQKAVAELRTTYEEEREKIKAINEELQNLINKF
jgi:hypothetical protein